MILLTIIGHVSFSEGAASFDSLLDTPHQTRIIELLILNVEVRETTPSGDLIIHPRGPIFISPHDYSQSIFGPEHIYLPKECSQAVPVDEMSQEEISADQTASESDSKSRHLKIGSYLLTIISLRVQSLIQDLSCLFSSPVS